MTDLTGQLRTKSRRRRAGLAVSFAGDIPARNDLLPALQLVHLRLDEIRVASRKTRPASEAHIAEIMRYRSGSDPNGSESLQRAVDPA